MAKYFQTIQEFITAIKTCLDIDFNPENVAPKPGKRAVYKHVLKFSPG